MKLFDWFRKKMNINVMDDIKLHIAGATVRHKSRFDHLDSYSNKEELSQEFIEKWTAPFYFNLHNTDKDWITTMINLKPDITNEIILKNLGDFNWRMRQTGAYFVAIKNKKEFIKIIGTHLLKSEVCYAGAEYAKVLASFNTNESIEYLEAYLEYYLLRPDLYFDQRDVMEALKYLDKVNGTNRIERHTSVWKKHTRKKGHSDTLNIELLERRIKVIEAIKIAN